MRADALIILTTVLVAVFFIGLWGTAGLIIGGALVAFAVIGARMERVT